MEEIEVIIATHYLFKETERTGANDSGKLPSRRVSTPVQLKLQVQILSLTIFFYQQLPKVGEPLTNERGTKSLLAAEFVIITDQFRSFTVETEGKNILKGCN